MDFKFYKDHMFTSSQSAQIDLTSSPDWHLCRHCVALVINTMNSDHTGLVPPLVLVDMLSATVQKFMEGIRVIVKFTAEVEMSQIEVEGHVYVVNGCFHVMGFLENSRSIHTLSPDTCCPTEIGSKNEQIIDTSGFIMSRSDQPPNLKNYMDMKVQIKLNANKTVVGTLRGFDQFMNLLIDNTVEVNGNEKTNIGMVTISGNSVVTIEALEPAPGTQ